MSATAREHADNNPNTREPTMFADAPVGPAATAAAARPGADLPELPPAARDAALDAVERALAASVRLRRALPPAARLHEPGEPPAWLRSPPSGALSDGSERRPRVRPSLDPVRIAPPSEEPERSSVGAMLGWVSGAVALAALAGLLAIGVVPLPFGGKVDGDANATSLVARVAPERRAPAQPPAETVVPAAVPAVSPDQAALVERFVALRQPQQEQPRSPSAIVPQPVKVERVVVPPQAVQFAAAPAQSVPPQSAPPPAPNLRALDRDELAVLAERGAALIEQGDIASARLMLTRAAEAGDAASALALGSTYDPDALKRLGVIGLAGDPKQAHAWYTQAVALGSAEASLRLERLAQMR